MSREECHFITNIERHRTWLVYHCLNKLEETKDFYTMIFMKHYWFTHTIRRVGTKYLKAPVWWFDPIVFDVTFRQHTVLFWIVLDDWLWRTFFDFMTHDSTDNVIFPVLKNIKFGAAIMGRLVWDVGRAFFGKCKILYSILSINYDYKNTCILKNIKFRLCFGN